MPILTVSFQIIESEILEVLMVFSKDTDPEMSMARECAERALQAAVEMSLIKRNDEQNWVDTRETLYHHVLTSSLKQEGPSAFQIPLVKFPGGGGGAPSRDPTPYPFIYHFSRKRHPFRIPSTDKWCPFHIPCLKLCIRFNALNALSFK